MAGVGYVILAHQDYETVERLARRLHSGSPSCAITIRHDRSGQPFDAARLRDLDRTLFDADSTPAPWGSWELTEAGLRSMVLTLRRRPELDWVLLLSGQSYPVRPLRELEDHLAASSADAILAPVAEGQDAADRLWLRRPYGADRSRFWYLPVPDRGPLRSRLVQRVLLAATGSQPFGGIQFLPRGLGPHLVVWKPLSPLRRGILPRKASQWIALRRAAVLWAAELLEAEPQWRRHFRRTLGSDELFLPTILHNLSGFAISSERLHFERRRPTDPHAGFLGVGDLDDILTSRAFFARKVSVPHDPRLLDALDSFAAR